MTTADDEDRDYCVDCGVRIYPRKGYCQPCCDACGHADSLAADMAEEDDDWLEIDCWR
jgi:hypothetical protein